jgi:hypothetical protein
LENGEVRINSYLNGMVGCYNKYYILERKEYKFIRKRVLSADVNALQKLVCIL